MSPDGTLDSASIRRALGHARKELLSLRTPEGFWLGELSSSALSTATAVTALAMVDRSGERGVHEPRMAAGLEWLERNQNSDGGWGDTTKSLSNISTTTLCWAAFGVRPVGNRNERFDQAVARAEQWLSRRAGGVTPDQIAPAIIARYGKDRTFSVPILTMCALAGRLGEGRDAWKQVIPLPFELAALPHQFFAALRLPVVSYALPALIAIGQARHRHAPSRNPLARLMRSWTVAKTLRVLEGIQPRNGGFLEATPLTSFVTMSLAGSGLGHHAVVRRGAEFLVASQRTDGSWPIDTNLSTWVSTLAVNALGGNPLGAETAASLRRWLLGQQYQLEHPYTHAAPGGWAWTDLPGGVPDADDTAGALLALRHIGAIDGAARSAATNGVEWLLNLQNRDGGVPTFCRGWGALPFDRSSADITAHAIRAWLAWRGDLPDRPGRRVDKALRRAIGFLARVQRADGAWLPLWFGNQFAHDDENPTYGTARVVCALADVTQPAGVPSPIAAMLYKTGVQWLVSNQNEDGGWSGAKGAESSVEETALAVEALAAAWRSNVNDASRALRRGVRWLTDRVVDGSWTRPSPIGFYFAKLWYFEKLYPLIFTAGALHRVEAMLEARG